MAVAELEAIVSGLYLEALTISEDAIFYGDVIEGGIHKLSLTGDHLGHWMAERKLIGGIALNHDGAVLVSGPGGIAWFHPDTGATGVLLDAIDGEPLSGVNEMVVDGQGGLYFGTSDLAAIEKGERPGPASVCHLATDGRATRLLGGQTFSNGMALTPDGLLVHNESFNGVSAYPVQADGALGERRFFIEKYDCDGAALDVEGNVWISGFTGPELICVTPDGTIRDRVAMPGVAVTNLRFGPDGNDLYLTTITPESAAGLAKGEMPTVPESRLCRMKAPVRGAAPRRAGFAL